MPTPKASAVVKTSVRMTVAITRDFIPVLLSMLRGMCRSSSELLLQRYVSFGARVLAVERGERGQVLDLVVAEEGARLEQPEPATREPELDVPRARLSRG